MMDTIYKKCKSYIIAFVSFNAALFLTDGISQYANFTY